MRRWSRAARSIARSVTGQAHLGMAFSSKTLCVDGCGWVEGLHRSGSALVGRSCRACDTRPPGAVHRDPNGQNSTPGPVFVLAFGGRSFAHHFTTAAARHRNLNQRGLEMNRLRGRAILAERKDLLAGGR